MRPTRIRALRAAATIVAMFLSLAPASGDGKRSPVISARQYVAGQAEVTVTGAFQVRATIPINKQASMSDGEMTWLQYGASGAEAPNALVTVQRDEIGIDVARDKQGATAGAHECKGEMKVSGALVAGHYECPNVTSYDSRSGQMGKVHLVIDFKASS